MVTSFFSNNFGFETNLGNNYLDLATLEKTLGLVREQLQNFASNPQYHHKLQLAFGNSFDPQVAQNFRQSWQKGDFSSIPVIQILTPSQLQGAKGAYALATNSIYLSEEFINTNKFNPEMISEVLLEEIGHFIDSRLHSIDSPGDEGAIFSVLVSQGILNIQQWQWFQQENDHRTMILDGQTVNVELADAYQGSNLSTIVNGLQTILTNLNTSLKTVALANQLPLVGNALKDVTDPALNFLNQLKNQLTSINTSSVSQVRQTLLNILGTGGLNWLRDRDSNGIINLNDIAVNDTANQVTFNFTLGNNPTTIAGGIGFNLGLPGLGLSVSDNSKVKTDIGFTFDFAFGANKDTGFFFDTGLTSTPPYQNLMLQEN
jgi:hypothetical protein